ncbi:hypothetical protein RDV64_12010 [Acuticoccus sp. MNP-M23]|uniref:hypothetical protein n=1 Tax=Acuticoccus sp. MNP-M23 TaxID=3072793 RepID=UPI002815A90D|nr:hypothetical protein [Acuticoccus sp. MNP-M23]WMS40825.1 hypothetical protein RDV64_12010 [Acuticoccus sp. MNP-M23]
MTAPKRMCAVSGCTKMTAGYSRYCTTHRATVRKQGHPEQTAIRRKELASFEEIVAKYLRNNPDAGAWKVLDQMWRDRVREARRQTEATQSSPSSQTRLAAAREIVKVDRDCHWQEIMAVVAAAWMLQEQQPLRVKSDDAMRVQVARLVRQIVPKGGHRYLDRHGNETAKAPYIPVRQSEIFGQWLIEAFAALGMRLLDLEKAEQERRILMRQELSSGLASLR